MRQKHINHYIILQLEVQVLNYFMPNVRTQIDVFNCSKEAEDLLMCEVDQLLRFCQILERIYCNSNIVQHEHHLRNSHTGSLKVNELRVLS